MALNPQVDYFGISSANGWHVTDSSENKTTLFTAEAQGPDGFVVAVESGGEWCAPSNSYVLADSTSLSSVVLGNVLTATVGNEHKYFTLGGITINTAAGSAPTMQATGQEIPSSLTATGCKCTLNGGLLVSRLFHAQDFGLFEVISGQLNSSTLTINSSVATAPVDADIVSWDLVGGTLTIGGEIIGVTDSGKISTPTVTILSADFPLNNIVGQGVWTQPLTRTRSNGQFASWSFEITYPLKADCI